MQSLDLTNGQIPGNSIHQLKPGELLYLRINSLANLSAELVNLISQASKITSYVILSIPGEEFVNEELRNKYFKMGIKGFSLRFTHKIDKWLKNPGLGQLHSGDRDLIDFYKKHKPSLPPNKELAVEFQVGDDTRILAPTITGLYELGARWVVLNVDGEPTRERCMQMRDVLEYIKIRNCPHLNVYFPFWKPGSAEWDIKTQNTFSGLEFVHIDISNRCTHSCVFCGLYGPDAIEAAKQRSGGEIPDHLKKLMKMEIDSEKCFKIIESLPWSVKMIQFGGMGDPLMHESSVKFIAAARRRGFAVEVLSNMEYLENADIQELHDLGGTYKSELHFIANISAGSSELYIKTRPKQTDKSYQKIIHNLSMFSKLRKSNNGVGVHFTIMCVVNKINCLGLLEVAELAKNIGACAVWFKPMEVHGATHEAYLPSQTLMKGMAQSLGDAIKFSEANGIEVFQKEYCEEIIRQHSGEIVNV